jgi:hypothetical protein
MSEEEEELPNLFRLYLVHQDKKTYRIRLYAMMDIEHPDNFVAFQDVMTRATQMAWWTLGKQETEFIFRVEQPYREKKYARNLVGVVTTVYHPKADGISQVEIKSLELDREIFGGIMESFKVFARDGLIETPTSLKPPKYNSLKDFPVQDLPEWPSYVKPIYQKYGGRAEVSYAKPPRQTYQFEEVDLAVREGE